MAERDAQGRWLSGQSPNPGERPKGRGLEQEIRLKLAEPIETREGRRRTRVERMAEILVSKAEPGPLRSSSGASGLRRSQLGLGRVGSLSVAAQRAA